MFGFDFGIKDVIDILLVATMMYQVFILLRRSGAANLFWGIFAFLLTWILVTVVFQLELTGLIFDRIVSVGAIALIIIFQEEIRNFIYRIGGRFTRWKFLSRARQTESEMEQMAQEIVIACRHMSKSMTGALIVISKEHKYGEYTDSGEQLDATVSARLIEQIFYKNTPLHDGAMFIIKGRIAAAACILPVSKNSNLPQHYGLRHRAAVGLTEKTDTFCIVVSEETGRISVSEHGLSETVSEEELLQRLRTL